MRLAMLLAALVCLGTFAVADDILEILASDAESVNVDIDREALKLDPELEVFAKRANPDQINLRLLKAFASNNRREKALVYAEKILASPTAPRADKIAVLNGADWSVRRSRSSKLSSGKDFVAFEKYWHGLIGMTDIGSRLTRYYRVGATDSIDLAERERMAEDNIKYRKMFLEFNPESAGAKMGLAREYIAREKHTDALPILEELYARPMPAPDGSKEARAFYTDVCMLYGNALFMKGDLPGAFKVMEKYLADGVFDSQQRGGGSSGRRDAKFYLFALRDHGRFNDIKLPRHTGARAYPEAKEAEYGDAFAPLTTVKLELGGGLTTASPQARYLVEKLAAHEIQLSDSAPFVIRFNSGSLKAPDKPEAYAIKTHANGADLQGADRAGTTWAASTFIQLIDHTDVARVRICSVRDWPDLDLRGNWGKSWDIGFPEFFIAAKLNLSAIGSYLDDSFWSMHAIMPMKRAAQKEYIRLMTELGINIYVTMPTSWYMPKTSERTLEYYAQLCDEIAGLGGNVWWLHDDSSADGQPEWDMRECGGDTYKAVLTEFEYLNSLYAAVKKKHPNFKLLFSPIYYFFDEGAAYAGIPKHDYMRDLGRMLDKEIEVMWCGPRVRGAFIKKEQTALWTNLARRKPAFWQNPYGPHEAFHIVLGDCYPGWALFHYKGFFDEITMYFDAGDIPIRGAMLMEYANFAWNLSRLENCAIDVAEHTQRLAYDVCYGKGALDVIKPGAEAIWELNEYPTYFATYMTHDQRSNVPRALMEYEHLLNAMDIAEKTWARMKELYPDGIKAIPTQYVSVMGRDRIGNAMDKVLLKAGRAALMEKAAQSGHFDAQTGDQFKSPAEFYGGAESQPIVYDKTPSVYVKPAGLLAPREDAYRKLIYGKGAKDVRKHDNPSSAVKMPDMVISLDQIQTRFFRGKNAKDDMELLLCGKNEMTPENAAGCGMEALVNDQKVFEGMSAFPSGDGADFGVQIINIPAGVLKDKNVLTIRNPDKFDPKASMDNPVGTISYFSIKYGVFRDKR